MAKKGDGYKKESSEPKKFEAAEKAGKKAKKKSKGK